jgi:hypothetical protein
MTEYLKENEMPVNQAAKKVLKNPDPSLLYCLQAAQEALETGKLQVRYPHLLDNLEVFLALWSPEGAMKFLEGEHDLIRDFPKKPDLLSVGIAVLEQLHSRLSAELIGYPRPRGLPANFR